MKTKKRARRSRRTPKMAISFAAPLSTYSWEGTSANEGPDLILNLGQGPDPAPKARLYLPPHAIKALATHLQTTQPAGATPVSNTVLMNHFRLVLRQVETAMNAAHQEGTPQTRATRGLFDLMRTVAIGLLPE